MSASPLMNLEFNRRRALQLFGIGAAAVTLAACAPTGTGGGTGPAAGAGSAAGLDGADPTDFST